MVKSSLEYYRIKNLNLDIYFDKIINIIYKKDFTDYEKECIPLLKKRLDTRFELKTSFVNNCLTFAFKIVDCPWEKVILNPKDINLKVPLLRISFYDTKENKYLTTKVYNIPREFMENINKGAKECDYAKTFTENKKELLKNYSLDILTDIALNRYLSINIKNDITLKDESNAPSKIKGIRVPTCDKILLKDYIKKEIKPKIIRKNREPNSIPILVSFGYGEYDTFISLNSKGNILETPKREYLNCYVKKAYSVEEYFNIVQDSFVPSFYDYIDKGVVIFIELPKKYHHLVKKQKQSTKLKKEAKS